LFCWSPLVSLLLLPLFVTLNMIPKVALGRLSSSGSVTDFCEHPDCVQHLLFSDPADDRARIERSRTGSAGSR